MKITKDNNYILWLDKNGEYFIEFYNEWSQIFGKWNWVDATIIEISFENDYMAPGYEFVFIILGFGIRIRLNRSWKNTKLQRTIDEYEEEKRSEDKLE